MMASDSPLTNTLQRGGTVNKGMEGKGGSRMNRYQKIAIGVMLFVPLIFLVISLLTNRWGFFLWSLAPSFTVGMTGFFVAKDK